MFHCSIFYGIEWVFLEVGEKGNKGVTSSLVIYPYTYIFIKKEHYIYIVLNRYLYTCRYNQIPSDDSCHLSLFALKKWNIRGTNRGQMEHYPCVKRNNVNIC